MGATKTSCMIAFILAGAAFLTTRWHHGVPRIMAQWIGEQGFAAWQLIAVLTVLYIILGCFIDGISMVVLTSSVILLRVKATGIDLLWFGIIRRAGRRDGADYAAGGLQPIRAARPHRQGHVLRGARLVALLHPDGARSRNHLEVSRSRHLSAGKDVQSELIFRPLAARFTGDLLRKPVTLLLGTVPPAPIYTTSAIRKLEELAAPASGTLMERAGLAAAEFARAICGDTAKSVLVIAGPGNNGGDAFEVAAHLKRWFFRVRVVFSGERDKLSKDARAALAKWEARAARGEGHPGDARFDLAVDGLFASGSRARSRVSTRHWSGTQLPRAAVLSSTFRAESTPTREP